MAISALGGRGTLSQSPGIGSRPSFNKGRRALVKRYLHAEHQLRPNSLCGIVTFGSRSGIGFCAHLLLFRDMELQAINIPFFLCYWKENKNRKLGIPLKDHTGHVRKQQDVDGIGWGIQDNQLFFLGYSNVRSAQFLPCMSVFCGWTRNHIFEIFKDGSVRIVFDFNILELEPRFRYQISPADSWLDWF